ncbi:putative transcriptional regulator [Pedobacter sp. BAL39]|uniref:RNA-binding domain-containing protein n=1 Tax=Pedobacter sp. BAL39 TaxID=391596 RepID=UPI000155993A|nr:RNA-binding domain-containing protein [Pedobacter sp. BAL39]EDM36246.1 putative transcriptional regulator [Pedobacter sp. BAL39]
MDKEYLKQKLNDLINLPGENETVEFKEANTSYDFSKLGKYFSALSNEANLGRHASAWFVMGVTDRRKIIGTAFRLEHQKLNSLKGEIANKTDPKVTFVDIHEFKIDGKRVLLFQIPPAPQGMPISFEGHYYARNGEELVPLNIEKIERIRAQSQVSDLSAEIVHGATIDDLDPEAIHVARINYFSKFPAKEAEGASWDDITFLNKAKITIKNKITKTAIILLGREESEHFLSPAEIKIRWVLKGADNMEKDYEVFTCPFLLAVDKVYNKIRNLKYRYITQSTLFPEETLRYEPYSIREALNNCIAHQDYTKGGRINVIEKEDDELIFTNYGAFIPGSVETVVMDDSPEEFYRNKFLATAMFNLKMVDTAGGGIKKIFNYQRQRLFPLPDYDLSGGKVKVTITGKVLDTEFANILAQHKELTLEEIIALDKVQKGKRLSNQEEKHLRAKKLIEGRKPNYYLSLKVASQAGQKAGYTKNRAFDKAYYLDLIIQFIKHHKQVERKDIDELLSNKLPGWMDEQQKKFKVNNLLSEMRKKEMIQNEGTFAKPKWILNDDYYQEGV